jgi:2-dehydro-3-deoxyglucarate aldolase
MVNSAAEANQAVQHCLYPPKGNRGVGLARAQNYGFSFEKHLKDNLANLEIFVQCEHVNAVREIEQITAIPEVSGVFLGPYDLSGSMGIPGQFEDPRMIEAIKVVSEATLSAGKFLGAHIIPADHKKVREFETLGYNFIAFSIDTFFLKQKLSDELKSLGRG